MIVLSGGGSRELARHLQPMISGNVVPFEPYSDSRLNNVFGYVKYGKFVWGMNQTLSRNNAEPSGAAPPEKTESLAAAA